MAQTLSRRGLLLDASGAAIIGLAPGAALAAAPMPIKIANAVGVLNQTMDAVMKQERCMESFGRAPEMLGVSDGSKILGAVVSGSVDCSSLSGFGQVFPAIERGAGLKVLAAGSQIPSLAMFTGRPNINSLKDLEGKSIGTGSIGALVHQLTVTLLRKYNVDTSKIRFVNIGSSANVFRAVQAGTVDAGPSETALIEVAGEYKVRPIPKGNMSVELPNYTFNASWTSDRKIMSNRQVLVKMLAAYAKLYRFVQNPKSKEAFFRARRGALPSASQADHQSMWDYLQKYKPFAENLIISPERIQYIQQLNVQFGVQKSILPYERVADMSLAKEALKLLG